MRRHPFGTALLVAGVLGSLVGTQGAAAQQLVKQPTAEGSGGAAATVDVLGTQAAIDTLRAGGNAVDAAVAAAGVLGVTEPFSSGIGGGGFMVIRTAKGKVTTIDGREKAPRSMKPDSFWENGNALVFNDARFSGISAGVPGTVDTWDEALRKYGTYSLSRALQPGIRVATNGFEVDQTFFDQTQQNLDYFNDVPSTAAIYLDPDGTPRNVGSTLRNPDMARAYERIAKLGPKGFYSGAIADAMVEAAQNPPIAGNANHKWRPGLMTMRDLNGYAAPEREPTRISYRGYDVFGMGPPSSGGSTVGEALNILEGYTLSKADRADALHRFIEASRFSFADRNAYLADPAYFDVPLCGLLSDSFAAERRALITDTAANLAVAPGNPRDNCGGSGAAAQRTSEGREGLSTTHLTVADADGMVVSYTFTIESTGGNGIVVPGWGFLLNNELTDFNFDSLTHPNRAEGGKRPRSSMSPTIVERNGKPFLAAGSPGGSTIITTVLQVLLERLDLGKTLPEAIASPRATQRNGAFTIAEQAFLDSADAQQLRTRFGHDLRFSPEIGAATGIEFLPGNRFLSAAEPVRRGGGSAGVVTPGP
ncbi:MAG: gamma-glutamyltransferase [Thermoleophilia bacterium]|nr:gamma-glutamyltransferase [Thermoleophilia bacterium]